MSMRFREKTVWLTGASSGIGEALAHAFHRDGARLVLSARRADELDRVASELGSGGEVVVQPLDVTDPQSIDAAAQSVREHVGAVDILVNNAGLAQRGRVVDTDVEVYRRLMEVNYFGPLMLTKAVLPSMLDRNSGHIVTVTSVAGKYGSPVRSGYNGAKHAAHGFFDALREEVADQGIDVTLIVPGAVRTNISLNALRGDGSLYGRMDRFLQQGLAPEDCAARVLDAVAARRREVVIANDESRRLVFLKRLSPWLLSRALRRRARRST